MPPRKLDLPLMRQDEPVCIAPDSGWREMCFTTYISMTSTIVLRLVLSYVLAVMFNMGVIGIALAMIVDWIFRGTAMLLRMRSGKWKKYHVI